MLHSLTCLAYFGKRAAVTILVSASGLLLQSVLPAKAAPGVPPGAFLLYPANSTRELVQEVEREPVVADRYKRHFYITTTGDVELALAQLHLTRLSSDRDLPVWYIHNINGAEIMGYKLRHVPAGTLVFADSKNAPILIAECGNPIGTVALPPAKSVAHNQFDLTPSLTTPVSPVNPQPYTPISTPTRIADLEIPTASDALPLRPPGLPQAHFSGLPLTGALALPFFFHSGGSNGGNLLGALPPQFSSSGGFAPHGIVPEGGWLSFVTGMGLPLVFLRKYKKRG
ncbi:hypothetical protein CWRG_01365 [Chthonomonas calidirosea]|uniref:hypothetical protein n=1 Tax=Chthonomonas calidirosea TaxID=454171 RepID=UPI0006DD530A|nr:hypothetical protein [Chthonomonas calidirosea]CEK16066.1 hypothetical protein CWRG_01365 [Chthonomonas calidirosea]